MNCERLRTCLPAHLDGDLSPEVAGRADRHLAECAPCRDELERLRAAVAALRATPIPPAPGAHVDAVMAAVAASAARGPRRTFAPVWASHLAAAAGGALVLWAALELATDGRLAGDPGADGTGVAVRVAAADPTEARAAEPQSVATAAGAGVRRPGPPESGPPESGPLDPAPAVRAPEPALAAAAPTSADDRPWRTVALPVPLPVFVAGGAPAVGPDVAAPAAPATTVVLAAALDRVGASLERWGDRYDVLAGESDALSALAHASDSELPIGGAPEVLQGSEILAENPSSASLGGTAPVAVQTQAPRPPGPQRAVRVQRVGERVRIETSGTLQEIVPALLVRLDDRDASVRAAVERRLVLAAADLGLEGPSFADDEAGGGWWRSPRARVVSGAEGPSPADRRSAWERWWATARPAR